MLSKSTTVASYLQTSAANADKDHPHINYTIYNALASSDTINVGHNARERTLSTSKVICNPLPYNSYDTNVEEEINGLLDYLCVVYWLMISYSTHTVNIHETDRL